MILNAQKIALSVKKLRRTKQNLINKSRIFVPLHATIFLMFAQVASCCSFKYSILVLGFI